MAKAPYFPPPPSVCRGHYIRWIQSLKSCTYKAVLTVLKCKKKKVKGNLLIVIALRWWGHGWFLTSYFIYFFVLSLFFIRIYKRKKRKNTYVYQTTKKQVLLKKGTQLPLGHNDTGTFSLFSHKNSSTLFCCMSEFSNSPPHAAQ